MSCAMCHWNPPRILCFLYSRVPNKRGMTIIIGGRGGGQKWFTVAIIGGWNNRGGGRLLGEIEYSRFLSEHVSFIYLCEQWCYWYIYFWTLVLLNALFETFSGVYSEIMLTIISFFQKLIKEGVGIRARGVGKFSKLRSGGGGNYSVLESCLSPRAAGNGEFGKRFRYETSNYLISFRLRRSKVWAATGTVCITNIVVRQAWSRKKLANLANTQVRREVLVTLPISPHYLCYRLRVYGMQKSPKSDAQFFSEKMGLSTEKSSFSEKLSFSFR